MDNQLNLIDVLDLDEDQIKNYLIRSGKKPKPVSPIIFINKEEEDGTNKHA